MPRLTWTNAISAIRKNVRDAIPEEASPLQKAVTDEIERATTLSPPSLSNAIRHISMPGPSDSGYDIEAVDGMFQPCSSISTKSANTSRTRRRSSFAAPPDGAAYEIQVANTQVTIRNGSTNEIVPTVWRGIYSGVARKAGYKRTRRSASIS